MNRDDAIEKIKKCLALSTSSNQNEAATALRQAQKLMQMHGIDQEHIQLADVQEAEAEVSSRAFPVWDIKLAHLVAETFGCQQLVMRGYRRSDFVFVGLQSSAQVAAYAYKVLARQCTKARSEHIAALPARCKRATKTARGDAFAYAWVKAIGVVLERFAGGEKAGQIIDDYMAKTYPGLGMLSKRRDLSSNLSMSSNSLVAGYKAGLNAQLDCGIGAEMPPQLLS